VLEQLDGLETGLLLATQRGPQGSLLRAVAKVSSGPFTPQRWNTYKRILQVRCAALDDGRVSFEIPGLGFGAKLSPHEVRDYATKLDECAELVASWVAALRAAAERALEKTHVRKAKAAASKTRQAAKRRSRIGVGS